MYGLVDLKVVVAWEVADCFVDSIVVEDVGGDLVECSRSSRGF